MGRKVHPYGFRLGFIYDWKSKWYAPTREYTKLLHEDIMLRDYLREKLDAENAGVADITIERFPPNQVHIVVHTARPGVVIGRKGVTVKEIRENIEKMTGKRVKLDIEEIVKPELVAALVAQNIAQQIEKRIPHNRAMKRAIQAAMQKGALGVRIECAGRLGGAEMKRTDKMMEGRIPRNTLRADIDFAKAEARTTYGQIGVKVWIYKGDVLPDKPREELSRPSRTQQPSAGTQRRSRGGRGGKSRAAATNTQGNQPQG